MCTFQKSACVLENSIITANEREEIRNELVRIEGINCPGIKIFKGTYMYVHLLYVLKVSILSGIRC